MTERGDSNGPDEAQRDQPPGAPEKPEAARPAPEPSSVVPPAAEEPTAEQGEAEEPDALARLRQEQERRWEQFRTEQEEAVRKLAGSSDAGPEAEARPQEAPAGGPPPPPPSTQPPTQQPTEPPTQQAGWPSGPEATERIPYGQEYQQQTGEQSPGYGQPPGYGQQQGGWGGPPSGVGAPPPGWGGPYPQGYAYAARLTEPTAIWAFVLSILSFAICPVIPAIVALVLASNAKRAIAESRGMKEGEGLATAAQVISWINLALAGLALAIIVIAIAASTSSGGY